MLQGDFLEPIEAPALAEVPRAHIALEEQQGVRVGAVRAQLGHVLGRLPVRHARVVQATCGLLYKFGPTVLETLICYVLAKLLQLLQILKLNTC